MTEVPFPDAKAESERLYFTRLLARAGNHKSKAAELAKIDRTTLYTHLNKLGLNNDD